MRVLLFSTAMIFAIAFKLVQLQPEVLELMQLQDDSVQLRAISPQLHAIAVNEVEASYFAPFAKVLNCNLIEFADSMNAVANRLQVPAVWIYRTCIAESSLNPRVVNEIGATGLIQFMPQTAKGLGTSTAKLRNMSAIQQLHYIEKFYKPAMNQIYSYGEFRLYAFFPAAIRWTNDAVLEVPGLSDKCVAQRNPSHDLNGDMQITKLEYLKSVGYVLTSGN